MTKSLGAFFLFLAAQLAHASEVVAPPVPEASTTGIIVFGIIFVGMVGGFALYVWKKERERKDGKNSNE